MLQENSSFLCRTGLCRTGAVVFFLLLSTGLFAQNSMPLTFNLSINPDADGTLTEAEVVWERGKKVSSSLLISYYTTSNSGDLPDYTGDSLYSLSTGDGQVVVNPFIYSGSFKFLRWTGGIGLGLKTEVMEERGNYEDLGVQSFTNSISSWRLGVPLTGKASTSFGPMSVEWGLILNPIMFYSLSQTQDSSLVAPEGKLTASSLIGPEVVQDIRLRGFSRVWLSLHHELLWLSVPSLDINELGDAWTSTIDGYTNQVFRLLGGVSLGIPTGEMDLGIGWKISTSAADTGSEVSTSDGLIFEVNLSAGGGK